MSGESFRIGGRPAGRGKVEACRSIDVNRLHRGAWPARRLRQWPAANGRDDGDKVTPTNMRAEHDRLHLTYRMRIGGGEWEGTLSTRRSRASSAWPVASAELGPISSAPAS